VFNKDRILKLFTYFISLKAHNIYHRSKVVNKTRKGSENHSTQVSLSTSSINFFTEAVVLARKGQKEGQILQAMLDYVRQLLYESSFYLQKEFTKPHNNQRKFSLATK
jgi:hypothetical protein